MKIGPESLVLYVRTAIHFCSSHLILLRMRNVSDKSCRENQDTHFVFSKFVFLEYCAVYEVLWKNVVERGRPQMTIWRMGTAPKATNTHSQYLILTAFPPQQWLQKHASMLSNMYSACAFFLFCWFYLGCVSSAHALIVASIVSQGSQTIWLDISLYEYFNIFCCMLILCTIILRDDACKRRHVKRENTV
jgi:hypothetical protein